MRIAPDSQCTQITDVRLIDPVQQLDVHTDVWVMNGNVMAIGDAPHGIKGAHVLHGRGRAMIPLTTDLCVRPPADMPSSFARLRRAALAGGVGRVVWVPGPASGGIAPIHIADTALDCRCVLKGVDIPTQWSGPPWAGVGYGISCVSDLDALRSAMQHAVARGQTIWLSAEDAASAGVMGAGAYALRLGLHGVDRGAQARVLDIVFGLAAQTGARLHVSGVANAPAVDAVRRAKHAGLDVSADTAIHHLLLVDLDIGFFDTRFRLMPPLYSVVDRDAINAAVIDGTIDAVVSDHECVLESDKARFFEQARPGAPALGLVLPLMLAWAAARRVPLLDALAPLTRGPERVLGAPGGLVPGMPADFCLVDLDEWWRADESHDVISPSLSPYHATMLTGRVTESYVRGVLCWELS